MIKTAKKLKQVENEVIFRKANEHAINQLEEILQSAKDNKELARETKIPLFFFCECSDETCRLRIRMTPKTYKQTHADSSCFIVLPGHNSPDIEDIVKKHKKYYVVEKIILPPKGGTNFKKT